MANPTRAAAQSSIQTSPVSHQEKTVTIPRALAEQAAHGLNDLAGFVQHASTIKDTVFRLLGDCDPLIARQLIILDDLIAKADDINGFDLATALWELPEAAAQSDSEAA